MNRGGEAENKFEDLVEVVLDFSDDDSDSHFIDCSEEENSLENSSDDNSDEDEPPEKCIKLQLSKSNLASTSTTRDELLELYDSVTLDCNDKSNPESYSATNLDLTWNVVTGKHLKNLPYIASNTGVSSKARSELHRKSSFDFFKYFITNDVINLMVLETNRYAEQKIEKDNPTGKSRLKQWKEVTPFEMHKFLGILIWMDLNKMPTISDYWSKNPLYQNEVVKNVLSRNRFELILRMWHFSDDEILHKNDCLFKIQPFVDMLLQRFQSAMVPEKDVWIDETSLQFHGRVNSKQDIKNKYHKLYKLRLNNGYTYNLNIDCEEEHHTKVAGSSFVILYLMKDLLDVGRTVYTSKNLTSVNLAHELLNRSTNLVGILKNNRKHNPIEVVHAKLSRGEIISKESNTGVIILKWKGKILMLSTVHTDTKREVQNKIKPDIVIDYNKCKTLVNSLDRIKLNTCTTRRSLQWFHKLAIGLITGTVITNAYILYKSITGKNIKLTTFKEEIVSNLLQLGKEFERADESILPTLQCKLTHVGSVRRRCPTCYEILRNQHDRKYATIHTKQTNYKCFNCNVFFCMDCFFLKHTVSPRRE